MHSTTGVGSNPTLSASQSWRFLSLGVLSEISILRPKTREYHMRQTSNVCLKRTAGLAIYSYFSDAGWGSGVSQAKLNYRFALTDPAAPRFAAASGQTDAAADAPASNNQ